MEHPAARSRTSPSSTFVVSDMPKSQPSLLYAVRTSVGKGRLPCLGILVLRGQRVRFPFFFFFLVFSSFPFPLLAARCRSRNGINDGEERGTEEIK